MNRFSELTNVKQFILWTIRDGRKFPINYNTAQISDAHDPAAWLDAATAAQILPAYGPGYGIGFVFTESDPFFFIDVDKCRTPSGEWSPLALEMVAAFPEALVEISQSGQGLHIIGSYSGPRPEHACKNTGLGLELYTAKRFVALTGIEIRGRAGADCTAALNAVIAKYFAGRDCAAGPSRGWTDTPVEGYTSTLTDDELIVRACASVSPAAAFTGRSFSALWAGDTSGYDDDESSADMALAVHLAFWTGANCERIRELMFRSGLVRDKWARKDYIQRTIINACSSTKDYFSVKKEIPAPPAGAVALRGSQKQKLSGSEIRAKKFAEFTDEIPATLKQISSAKFWIDNAATPAAELAGKITPDMDTQTTTARLVSGIQYLPAPQQIAHFKGCTYVKDQHRILTPDGSLLKPEQFNAVYGGYTFQLDEEKTTRKAFEAFTESQLARFPKADAATFRPDLKPGEIIDACGQRLVNSYVDICTPRAPGDPSPFLDHLKKVLPDPRDREILLAWLAAVVQYKGVKFKWSPLLQGAEGNGKSLFTFVLIEAIGRRYAHVPPASEIGEKFNSWLFNTIVIGIEDIQVAEHKRELLEILKPMITGDWQSSRLMQSERSMRDVCCNFIFNSNHKDAVRKTQNDRRFAVFYTAQQTHEDIVRDGMAGDYFPRLYDWLKNQGGYAIVHEFLATYKIPAKFNPATDCQRAPITSSTGEAVTASLGSAEQEILEAIDEGRIGFAGGWISSIAVDDLLHRLRLSRAIPPNKRRALLQDLGFDWHPALKDGRVNNPTAVDGGKKPRLFIKCGHIHAQLTTAAEVLKHYIAAQIPTEDKSGCAFKQAAV